MREEFPKFDWAGWVCAYTSQGGNALNGYLGRVVKHDHERCVVKLAEAIEFLSVTQQQQSGGMTRTMRMTMGQPLEMCGIKATIDVRYVALLDISATDELRLIPFAAARAQAAELLRGMTEGPPRIHLAGH